MADDEGRPGASPGSPAAPAPLPGSPGDEGAWATWIADAVAGRRVVGGHSPAETDTQPLLSIFRALEDGHKRAFGVGLARAYVSVPPEERCAREYYLLVQVITVVRPPEALPALMDRLRRYGASLQAIEYGRVDLHRLTLAAAGSYGVDEELAEYVRRTSQQRADLPYLLLGFRLLARYDPIEGFRFLERVIPHCAGRVGSKALQRALSGVLTQTGYRPFYLWATRDLPRLRRDMAEPTGAFERMLREGALTWRGDVREDPYRFLLAAYLHAGHRPFTAAEVVELARTCLTVLEVDGGEPERVLQHVWRSTEGGAARWAGRRGSLGVSPWTDNLYFESYYAEKEAGGDRGAPYKVFTPWRPEVVAALPDLDAQEASLEAEADGRVISVILRTDEPAEVGELA